VVHVCSFVVLPLCPGPTLGGVVSLRSLLRRRPFVALLVLIVLLLAGYTARAVTGHGPSGPSTPVRSSVSVPPATPPS
jgi:hypothetical protein